MKIKKNVLLAPYTSFQIGGPAEFFYEAKTTKDLLAAIDWAQQQKIPFLVLGKASNVLIADQGVKGLVIINSTDKIKLLENNRVELDSGVFLPKAIFYLIDRGLTGLEVFSGIPGTVGGATAVKMHGVGANWQDFVISIKQHRGVILSVRLQLRAGNKALALAKAKAIQFSKRHQPQRSAGCIFRNLADGRSVGEIIDKQLQLKGTKIGQAVISSKHANFIENLGAAKAKDVLQLIKLVKEKAKKELGLSLELEIQIYG